LPIPTQHRSETTYADIGFSTIVEAVTKGRITGDHLCHHDPMFEGGRCAFGQANAAQTHLANNAVGIGDVFLFFGLFSEPNRRDQHHRIFGYLKIEKMIPLGAYPVADDQPLGFTRRHPHTLGEWNSNNTLYLGPGQVTRKALDELRLSRPGNAVSTWRVPSWLRETGLTYHPGVERWKGADTLNVVARGQEFVSDVGARPDAARWLEAILTELRRHAADE